MRLPKMLSKLSIYAFLMFCIGGGFSCSTSKVPIPKNETPFVNWNVAFKPTSDSLTRRRALEEYKAYANRSLTAYLDSLPDKQNRQRYSVVITEDSCSCDPTLYNIEGEIIGPQTGSKSSGSGQPAPGVSGDVVESIEQNHNMNPGDPRGGTVLSAKEMLTSAPIDTGFIIAIIDTGIDTLKFGTQISNIIWKDDADGTDKTTRNFLPHANPSDFRDGHPIFHGSVVAAIILQQFKNYYPKLMVLKAMTDSGQGSVFSVSCAAHYAFLHNAKLVNTSLGFYGDPDPILLKYLNSREPLIPVITAAGNTIPRDKGDKCDSRENNLNLLTAGHLFFPACYDNLPNLVSVTGYNKSNKPCFFQNYSDKFVTVGVQNDPKSECCGYKVGFINGVVEGTSFATPVVTGRLGMKFIGGGGSSSDFVHVLNDMSSTMPPNPGLFTIGGKFIPYNP